MNTKSIEEVIAEIDAALQENENVSFPNVAYTQHTINRFGNPPIQDEILTRDERPGGDAPTVFDDTPDACLPDHFSIRELVQHRRWTRAEILTMLGEPDMKVTLRHSYHTAHLYAKARVLAVERSPVWRNVIGRLSQIPLPEHRLNPETFFCNSHGNTEYRRHGYLILCVHCYPVEGQVYYRVRDLYNRGWYAKEIPIFFGEPHHFGESGSGFGAAKLYLKGVVHHTEATEGWQNRPSAVAKRLYLDGGNSRAKIAKLLGITQSECFNYTKSIRNGKMQEMP